MFHWTDNLYFGRRADGSVRIIKLATTPADFPKADEDSTPAPALLDVTIPAAEWASIIVAVSATGESGEKYRRAVELHAGA